MELMTPQMVEAHARKRGVSITAACKSGNISRRMFERWRSGASSPTLRWVESMISAIDDVADRDGRTPAE